MRWQPDRGHVPRGFLGATGSLKEIELVLVFAEPGDPHEGESHNSLDSALRYLTEAFRAGTDLFHRNVRHILDSCWPTLSFDQQLKKVWMTESSLCSALTEGGKVSAAVVRECGTRYLLEQLLLLDHALVVALGSKARERLAKIGFCDFLPVAAAAPPGCNHRGARESWNQIASALQRKRL
jgi:hypothetical protein